MSFYFDRNMQQRRANNTRYEFSIKQTKKQLNYAVPVKRIAIFIWKGVLLYKCFYGSRRSGSNKNTMLHFTETSWMFELPVDGVVYLLVSSVH